MSRDVGPALLAAPERFVVPAPLVGHAKELFERGLSEVGGSVCARCFDDRGLADFVKANAIDHECEFCGRSSTSKAIAASLDDVIEYILDCIERDYEDPAESVGWCSEDGGYLLSVLNTDELLTDELGLDLPNDHDQELFEKICDGLGGGSRQWVRHDPYGAAPEQVSIWSWERFSTVVKHERRFFFQNHSGKKPDDFDELLLPSELLKRIGTFSLDHSLVRSLPKGTTLYRVRKAKPGEHFSTPLELGPAPIERCLWPSRMSPAGIPMFYGADDVTTALKETVDDSATYFVGTFETTRKAHILDLTNVPRVPSIFEPISDTAESDPRHELEFLHSFVHDVSQPIDRKNRAHVDYVPTQVVAEYLRGFELPGGRRLDGIKYTSAQNAPRACYVLFGGQETIIPSEEDAKRFQAQNKAYLLHAHKHAWLRLLAVKKKKKKKVVVPSVNP